MPHQNFPQILHLILKASLFILFIHKVDCYNFSYTSFDPANVGDFAMNDSEIANAAIQVTMERYSSAMANWSGRVWYAEPFKLWSKEKNITASFNTSFVINISPNPIDAPWGEGLAFILTKDKNFKPNNSHGQWLGIVNATTDGSPTNNIVAVEFDTRKSYDADLDDNHVGVDVNSISSQQQFPLSSRNVNLASGGDINARIEYDGMSENLRIYVAMPGQRIGEPIMRLNLDLTRFLPEDVFVGFSGSTGSYKQLNCIKAWDFNGTDIAADDDGGGKVSWLWIFIPSILAMIMISTLLIYLWWRRKSKVLARDGEVKRRIESSGTAPKKFHLKDMKRATGNFDPKNVLGRGGCGVVYRGMIGDQEVAVKRFSKDSSQGKQDFVAEVTTIANLHHKNLVKLIGWCYEEDELIVIYELMPNGSLDKLIFCDEKGPIVSWKRREWIIHGVAQTLDYLHNGCEKRVLHRDIKTSNVMLDSEFNAKLGDFGLARTIQVSGKTHHSTEIAGTPAYMAPESFHLGRATVETDVYAFGVLMLEVICGRKPVTQHEDDQFINRIVDWVWELHKVGRIIEAVDTRLAKDIDTEQAERLMQLALACCQPNPHLRPSMRRVLQVLTGEATPPPIPKEKPAFVWPAMAPLSDEESEFPLASGQLSPITVLIAR